VRSTSRLSELTFRDSLSNPFTLETSSPPRFLTRRTFPNSQHFVRIEFLLLLCQLRFNLFLNRTRETREMIGRNTTTHSSSARSLAERESERLRTNQLSHSTQAPKSRSIAISSSVSYSSSCLFFFVDFLLRPAGFLRFANRVSCASRS